MALRNFERLKPDEVCSHCGLTLKDKRQHNKSAAPCAAAYGNSAVICTEVVGPSDIRDDDQWVWAAPSPAGWVGGILRKKEQLDAEASAVLAELNRLRTAANDPSTGLRERTKAARQSQKLERIVTRAEEAKRTNSKAEYAEAKALMRHEVLRIEQARTKGLSGITPGLPPVQHKPLVQVRKGKGGKSGRLHRAQLQSRDSKPDIFDRKGARVGQKVDTRKLRKGIRQDGNRAARRGSRRLRSDILG